MKQIGAAEDRADARAQAVQEALDASDLKVFHAKAEALLTKLPQPAGFAPTESAEGNPCGNGMGISSCFLTAMTPRPALSAYLDALRPLGLLLQKDDCDVIPQLSARAASIFGKTPPCAASGKVAGLSFSAASFPQRDQARSTRGRNVFSGTQLSFSLINA